MAILCGFDFSDASRVAVRAAAALAKMFEEPVLLVHAVEPTGGPDGTVEEYPLLTRERLARKAESLRARGIETESIVTSGVPDEVLLSVARQRSARCLVVGAFGHKKRRAPELGSHADRLAQQAKLPVLVVRDAAPFEEWARKERPLKILLGVDLSDETPAAAKWVAELCRTGPCEVTATHLYWPPAEWGRLGFSGVREILNPVPDVTAALEREFEPYRAILRDAARLDSTMEPTLGSYGSRLAELAGDRGADLIVVGTRPRSTIQRWWEGSVSRAVLEYASVSVMCVPGERGAAALSPRSSAESVLVATDFSEVGNAALRVAYQLVGPEGTLHLVHVTGSARDSSLAPHDIFASGPQTDAISKRLAALVPEKLSSQIRTGIHVLNASNCSQAICQAAERLGVGTICLGTHGRSGVARAILGSVAAGVLAGSQRRVVLVRPTARELKD